MKHSLLAFSLLSVMLFPFLTKECSVYAKTDYQAMKDEIVMQVNEQRQKVGAGNVYESELLNRAADIRAKELLETFSHTRPDGSRSFTVIEQIGGDYMSAAENIAYGYRNENAVMEGWVNSSGHYHNMIGTDYRAMGVGIAEQNGTLYWVQIFTDGMGLTSLYTTGNLNGDKAINAEDASMILIDSAKTGVGEKGVLSRLQRSYADIDKNNQIDASDAGKILEYSAYVGTGGTASIEEYFN